VSCERAGVYDPQGPVASAEWLLFLNATEIMLVVVVPVILATIGFAWWYRASNPLASRQSDIAYEGRIELVVWSIPALVGILVGGVTWISCYQLDPAKPLTADAKPLDIEVVALDWKWLFIYPDQGVAAINRLVIPAGTPVSFRLTSATVMNSFFVPQLGSQIYAMGGMTTRLNLLADQPGEFAGISANFSGDGFAEMRFTVESVPPASFDHWVAAAKADGAVLDDAGYAALAQPSRAVPAATFGTVEPQLFDSIIQRTLSGPGTPSGQARCAPVQQGRG